MQLGVRKWQLLLDIGLHNKIPLKIRKNYTLQNGRQTRMPLWGWHFDFNQKLWHWIHPKEDKIRYLETF